MLWLPQSDYWDHLRTCRARGPIINWCSSIGKSWTFQIELMKKQIRSRISLKISRTEKTSSTWQHPQSDEVQSTSQKWQWYQRCSFRRQCNKAIGWRRSCSKILKDGWTTMRWLSSGCVNPRWITWWWSAHHQTGDDKESWSAVGLQGLINPSPALRKWCQQYLDGKLLKRRGIPPGTPPTSWTTPPQSQMTPRDATAAATTSDFGNQSVYNVFLQEANTAMLLYGSVPTENKGGSDFQWAQLCG